MDKLQADLDSHQVAAEGSLPMSMSFAGFREQITEVDEESESTNSSINNRGFRNLYLEPSSELDAQSQTSKLDQEANTEAQEEFKQDH